MEFFARTDGNDKNQYLLAHIDGVVRRMDHENYEFQRVKRITALLHDAGKFSEPWQNYMLENTQKKIPHSIYGMAILDELLHIEESRVARSILKDIVGYSIGAHHGLFDYMSDGDFSIDKKIEHARNSPTYDEVKKNFFNHYSRSMLQEEVKEAIDEVQSFIDKLRSGRKLGKEEPKFMLGFVSRMILSALIDSDWADAAAFYDEKEEQWGKVLAKFNWQDPSEALERYLNSFNADSALNRMRKKISEECKQSSDRGSGIYKLHVPTGGAKTLSVMRFALNHASIHNKDRIFYLAPFKSILDQNAMVYKKVLLNRKTNQQDYYILEHHSDVVLENHGDQSNLELTQYQEYLADRWDAPIILTTMVQFLFTLFSANKRSVRRCHRLENAVIIIDEFQSVPANSVSLLNYALNALADLYNATIVLCTATQPPFDVAIGEGYEIPAIHYQCPSDLTANYSKEDAFLRTEVIDDTGRGELSLEEVTEYLIENERQVRSLLCIVNTRDAAAAIFRSLISKNKDESIYILSNNMIPAHRQEILEKVKYLLDEKKKVFLISTSLLEAGVDISCERVVRSLIGLDSIAQSAGRCNRNKEKKRGEVKIIHLSKEVERTDRMEEMKLSRETMLALLHDYKKNPSKYDHNLLSDQAIRHYYENYLVKLKKKTHYPMKVGDYEFTAFEGLSINPVGIKEYREKHDTQPARTRLKQLLKTVGENYFPIDSDTISVLVPWGEKGKELVRDLNSELGIYAQRMILREASRYSVQLMHYRYHELKELGAITIINNVPVLAGEYYTEIGVSIEPTLMETISY